MVLKGYFLKVFTSYMDIFVSKLKCKSKFSFAYTILQLQR